jgi:predicted TIM-barrel fold metal-dependent hydrolase
MIVDSHFHAWPAESSFAPDRAYLPAVAKSIDDGLAEQARHGVTHGVLIQPSFLSTDNSYILECLEAWPDRLRATAVVDPDIAEDELERMDRLGVVGFRLNLHSSKTMPNYTSPAYYPLYEWAAAKGWHVEILAQGAIWADVLQFLRPWDLTVVVDHFGIPSPKFDPDEIGVDAILAAGRERRAWVKFSAPYRQSVSDLRGYAARLLAAFGRERVVWASDYPWTKHEEGQTYGALLDALADWVPEEEIRKDILGRNAARLFRFQEPA